MERSKVKILKLVQHTESTRETTIESSPEDAARFVRALKAQTEAQRKIEKAPNWFSMHREEVKERLGRDTIWDEAPVLRGRAFEILRRANLASNYPVVDDIQIEAGTATSMKTLDISTKPYQNADLIDSTVRGYVDKLSSFSGFKWNDREYHRGQEFQGLYLEIGIPDGKINPEQVDKLLELQMYAESQDVQLVIVRVP